MGVVASARRQHLNAAHAKSRVIQYMDFVLTREDYTHSKPHPEPYLTAMERHGLRLDECIVVEDSERGLAAAAAAGVGCIILLIEWTRLRGQTDFTSLSYQVKLSEISRGKTASLPLCSGRRGATMPFRWKLLYSTLLSMAVVTATSPETLPATPNYLEANRVLRDGAIAYGNTHYDPQAHLVRRVDGGHNQLDVCQHSLEYAAALLSADEQLDRANAVISAVLDHQDLAEGSPTFGNFRWWHGEQRVRDRNAVCFMSPWLVHILLEYGEKLSTETTRRLKAALPHCVCGVRAHGSGPDYTNIWLLKAASMVMLGRALDQAELQADGAARLDRWIELVARQGIGEYNSPCYNAVDVYALEWIYHYTSDEALRNKAAACLDYLYADVFQHWHWEAGIGAGTHSRAYERDRDSGLSLVSCLVFKQCGQPLRQPLRSFLYVFAVNDYPLAADIRAAARKDRMYPLSLRYRVLRDEQTVDCSLYMTRQFSLGTQTGRRPVYNDRPLWDIPLKITYTGSKVERRATYISPKPTTHHATVASVQCGAKAIVLYEVDLKGSRVAEGCMRLDIEPAEGGMCNEIIVDGRPYDRSELTLRPGTVVGWRVAETLVGLRLLRSWGFDPNQPASNGPTAYRLGPRDGAGLCIDCLLARQPSGSAVPNDLNCGFVIACTTTREHRHLADFLETLAGWPFSEQGDGGQRQIGWKASGTQMQLEWDATRNRVVAKTINGQLVTSPLRYDSPLIRLLDGEKPRVRQR